MLRWTSLLTNRLPKGIRRKRRSKSPLKRRLSVESLEDRRMLAVVTVSNSTDIADGSVASIADLISSPGTDGTISLREAIQAANATAGDDTVDFDASLNGDTILLDMGELEITEELTITGPGADLLTIDANQLSRIFNIDDGGIANDFDVMIAGLTLTGGKTFNDNADFSDATNSGGAIRSRTTGNLSIKDSAITGNSTEGKYALGGGFDAYDVTLSNSTVSDNYTAGDYALGGGISAGNVTLTNSIVSGNSTTGESAVGGGIYAYSVTLSNSTVSDNSTMKANALGGGIFSNTDVVLTNSTVSGNSTAGESSYGGGIFALDNTVLTNTTISGNSTTGTGSIGGGMFAYNATVNHSTITKNDVEQVSAVGGGLFVVTDLTIAHSIVAGNTAGGGSPDLQPGSGTLTVDYSLIGNTSGTLITILTGTGNLLNIAADLFPLADNGGPTQTHIPMPTSPVIDAGNSAASSGVDGVPEFDQRGIPFVRVRDGNGDMTSRIDIGATEVVNQLNGPQVIGLSISDNNSTVDVFSPKSPTLVGRALEIKVRDLPPRSNVTDAPAVDFTFAGNKALYSVVGDNSGNIAIASVEVDPDPITPGQPATATIRLIFAEPLPDDQFTLTVSDSVRDLDGNRLDGEWNADEPLTPGFPSGDGMPGGDFVASFTLDSRPELGVYGAGQVFIDANGNSTFDPSNHDLVFLLGYSTDSLFAGNFVQNSTDDADGFDKLAVYGREGNQWRWQIDVDNDGLPDVLKDEPLNIHGIPIAGDFDGNSTNGDEVGVFTGTSWYFDIDHDFQLDAASELTISNLTGYPVVGDFNGDGFDDLGTYNPSAGNNSFSIALFDTGTGDWSTTLLSSRVGLPGSFSGFAGVRERPVAADMNADGVDDLGLWVPDGSLLTPTQQAEWFFLLSNNDPTTTAVENSIADRFTAGGGFVAFSTAPFGNDLFFQFGNPYMLPLVGNFDPPPTPNAAPATSQVSTIAPTVAQPAPVATSTTKPAATTLNKAASAPEKGLAFREARSRLAVTLATPELNPVVIDVPAIVEAAPTLPLAEAQAQFEASWTHLNPAFQPNLSRQESTDGIVEPATGEKLPVVDKDSTPVTTQPVLIPRSRNAARFFSMLATEKLSDVTPPAKPLASYGNGRNWGIREWGNEAKPGLGLSIISIVQGEHHHVGSKEERTPALQPLVSTVTHTPLPIAPPRTHVHDAIGLAEKVLDRPDSSPLISFKRLVQPNRTPVKAATQVEYSTIPVIRSSSSSSDATDKVAILDSAFSTFSSQRGETAAMLARQHVHDLRAQKSVDSGLVRRFAAEVEQDQWLSLGDE